MTKTLQIAKDLDLPIDAVTQKIAWLGRTGSGKTYGAKRMVEQMLKVAQVVILDCVGVWPGLRLGPKAIDIPVIGGLFGDIPLNPKSGAMIADIIVDHATSMVIDVSQLRNAERTRFAEAFAEQFFVRKKAAPGAVHLVLEECQEFCPQNPQPGEQGMLSEFQRIAKLGRNFGIGVSCISQRPQEVNKKVLNQSECVFAFQMTGPHERQALQYWLSDKGFEEKLSDILPKLAIGAPHVWSPQWLNVSKVVQILPIDTLDTSSTPKVGDKAFAQKKLKPLDLRALLAAMEETIEKAKADDPEALRARVAELERELAERPSAEPERVEVPVISEAQLSRLEIAAADMLPETAPKEPKRVSKATTKVVSAGAGERHPEVGDSGLARILIVLAQEGKPLNRKAVALRAGLVYGGSTFDTYVSRARGHGWLDGKSDLAITADGVTALGAYEAIPMGRAVFKRWLAEVGGGGIGRLLQVLGDAYPAALPRAEAAKLSGLTYGGSTLDTYVSRLRGMTLIEGRSELKVCREVFGGAR